ncbi:MAG: hypothetical protein P4L16_07250 [Chlamydiales bacterium]|nr:hypothetical protein [Chlamydiales bacterium]
MVIHFQNEVTFHRLLEDLSRYGEKGHESLKIVHTIQGDTLKTVGKEGIWGRIWNYLNASSIFNYLLINNLNS